MQHYHPQARQEPEELPQWPGTPLKLGCSRQPVDIPGIGVPRRRLTDRDTRAVKQGREPFRARIVVLGAQKYAAAPPAVGHGAGIPVDIEDPRVHAPV
jgi:hypothetical protein